MLRQAWYQPKVANADCFAASGQYPRLSWRNFAVLPPRVNTTATRRDKAERYLSG
jgi:hypothetical protein